MSVALNALRPKRINTCKTGHQTPFKICGLQCNEAYGPKAKQDVVIYCCRGPKDGLEILYREKKAIPSDPLTRI